MSGREGHDALCEFHQVFRFAGEEDHAIFIIAVIERPDADRVAGCDILTRLTVIKYAGELRIQHCEHIRPVLAVHRQNDLTVAVACKCIPFFSQLFPHDFESVKLSVADNIASVQLKGLHT